MMRHAIWTASFAAALASLSLSAARAADAAPISYAEATALSPHDLAIRSFDQLVSRFTDKIILPPKEWAALAPGQVGLDLAEFAQPPVAIASGLCGANMITFLYGPARPQDAGSARDAHSVLASEISVDTVFAIVGATGAPSDKPDEKTRSECAKLTAFSPGFFKAGSGTAAYAAAMLLAEAKPLAAAPSPPNFTFSCIAQAASCADTRDMLATLDMKSIMRVIPCVTNFDDPPKGRCQVVQINPHPTHINLKGPNHWYVKIDSEPGGVTVQMKPVEETMTVERR